MGLVVANGLEEVERYLHYSCEGLIDGKQLIGEVFIKKNQSLEDAKEMLRDLLLRLVWVRKWWKFWILIDENRFEDSK